MANTAIQTNSVVTLNIDAGAAATGNAAALSQSPLLGGRRVKWRASSGCLGVKLQFAPRVDPATGLAPAAGSATWTDATLIPAGPGNAPPAVVTLLASTPQSGEVFTDYWVRAVSAGTGTNGSQFVLEGIQ
jgi:hypothetical protein